MFTGTCRGGPYDGTRIQHYNKLLLVQIAPQLKFTLPSVPPPDQVEIRHGFYSHVAEQWIWHDDGQG